MRKCAWFRNPDVWAPSLLVLLGILFFADPLFSSKNFYFRDILNFHYPLRRALIDSYARGEWPLWNPFVYLGKPMLANPNYMAFYPSTLLHLFMPFNYAFKLHLIVHPVLGGVGLYFLARRLGIVPLASLGGSLAYEFSGTVLSFLNLYNIVPAVALIPWIGWAFSGALQGRWLRRTLIFGALLSLQAVALEPIMFQCNLWFLASLSLYHILRSQGRLRAAGTVARTGLVGGVFAFGLAAVQILPTLELFPVSTRGSGESFALMTLWSMHPVDLINTAVPSLFGDLYTMGRLTSWGESLHNGREGYIVSYFLGASTLFLGALSLAGSRRLLAILLMCLACVGAGLALGRFDPVYNWLFAHLPLFGLGRYPSKYFLLTTLALSLSAALGIEVLVRPDEDAARKRRVLVAGICCLSVAAIWLACGLFWKLHPGHLEQWVRFEAASGPNPGTKNFGVIIAHLTAAVLSSGIFASVCSLLLLSSPLWRHRVQMGGIVVLLVAAEIIPANLRLTPLGSDAQVNFAPEVDASIAREGPREPFRVFPATSTFLRHLSDLEIRAPNGSTAWFMLFMRRIGQPFYGFMSRTQYSVDTSIDGLNTSDSEEIWKACFAAPQPILRSVLMRLNTPLVLSLDDVTGPGVRHLATFDTSSNFPLKVYWVENAVSRVYLASNAEVASSHEDALRRFLRPDFDCWDTVVLEDHRRRATSGLPAAGSTRIERYTSQRITCRVEARVPAYLVLLDSYYPGWRAYVDGSEVGILRANFAFRAVEVPAGRHEVEFRYRPVVFYWGLGLTLVTVLSGVLAVTLMKHSDIT